MVRRMSYIYRKPTGCKNICSDARHYHKNGVMLSFQYGNSFARRTYRGNYKICRRCERLYVGLNPESLGAYCYCCGNKLATRVRNNVSRRMQLEYRMSLIEGVTTPI